MNLNKKADKHMLPIQSGDVAKTWANMGQFTSDFNFYPNIAIREGVKRFVDWYKSYNNNKTFLGLHIRINLY